MAKIVKKRELRKRQRVAERQGGVPRRYNAVMSQKIPAAFCLLRENVLFLWIGIINPRFETMKKFLFLIMALGALGAMAGETFVSGGLKYTEIGNGFVKVGKISDEAQPKGTLVIPPTVKHGGEIYVVSKIDSWGFFGCRGITRVQLPPTLTVIDIWAFTCCESLLGIDIPSSVTEIGYALHLVHVVHLPCRRDQSVRKGAAGMCKPEGSVDSRGGHRHRKQRFQFVQIAPHHPAAADGPANRQLQFRLLRQPQVHPPARRRGASGQ